MSSIHPSAIRRGGEGRRWGGGGGWIVGRPRCTAGRHASHTTLSQCTLGLGGRVLFFCRWREALVSSVVTRPRGGEHDDRRHHRGGVSGWLRAAAAAASRRRPCVRDDDCARHAPRPCVRWLRWWWYATPPRWWIAHLSARPTPACATVARPWMTRRATRSVRGGLPRRRVRDESTAPRRGRRGRCDTM